MLFSCIVKAHKIKHASCQHAFFSTCINLILKKEYAGLRVNCASFWERCSGAGWYSWLVAFKIWSYTLVLPLKSKGLMSFVSNWLINAMHSWLAELHAVEDCWVQDFPGPITRVSWVGDWENLKMIVVYWTIYNTRCMNTSFYSYCLANCLKYC